MPPNSPVVKHVAVSAGSFVGLPKMVAHLPDLPSASVTPGVMFEWLPDDGRGGGAGKGVLLLHVFDSGGNENSRPIMSIAIDREGDAIKGWALNNGSAGGEPKWEKSTNPLKDSGSRIMQRVMDFMEKDAVRISYEMAQFGD